MCKEAYNTSTYKKCTQSLTYNIFCHFSQHFVPSKHHRVKPLDNPYHNNCCDIMLFNCCKIIVKTPCSYKSLKHSYQNTLNISLSKDDKFRKCKF